MTPATIEKAALIVHDDRIKPVGVAALYEVQGDHATYTVTLGDPYVGCTCPARGLCSHIAAAMLKHEQIGDRRAAAHLARKGAAAI